MSTPFAASAIPAPCIILACKASEAALLASMALEAMLPKAGNIFEAILPANIVINPRNTVFAFKKKVINQVRGPFTKFITSLAKSAKAAANLS